MNRRKFIQSMGISAVVMGIPALGQHDMPSGSLRPAPSPDFIPDVELELVAQESEHLILPGTATRTWSYTGELLKGRPDALKPSGSYLGPTIRVRRGEKVRVHFRNELPEPSIVHWHGLTVPELMDGHPRLVIPRGSNYVYEFEVQNRAAQYWYHPHPHQLTGQQVYRGMAGLFIVEDDEEASLGLPSGEHEITLVLQDRSFDAGSQLVYVAGHMDAMMGFLGDQIVVNGSLNNDLSLGTAIYRLRLLNGSNSRIYKLAWSDRSPMVLIGTDGGLLEQPVRKPYITLAPAERADLILDLSQRSVGSQLELRSLTFSGAQFSMGGMGGGMMGRGMGGGMMGGGMGQQREAALAQGSDFRVLRIRVDREESSTFRLPERLSQPGFEQPQQAENWSRPRVYPISHGQMQWLLNGATFDMTAIASNEVIKSDSLEIWEFTNSGGGMMQMAHPMHLHCGQFQVLERVSDTRTQRDWQSVNEGLTDEGWKDTVLVMPGERVRLLMRFPSYKGLFLYHCHNLEHEDLGLMRNFRLV